MKKFAFKINGNEYDVEIKNIDDNVAEVEVNGFSYSVEFDRVIETTKTPKLVRREAVSINRHYAFGTENKFSFRTQRGQDSVKSPLPGTIIDVHVNVGDFVRSGDRLVTLEAMKMENIINSDKGGKVASVNIKKGDSVMEGDILIEIG